MRHASAILVPIFCAFVVAGCASSKGTEVLQQARVLAERLQRDAGANNEAKIVLAYKLLYSRSPEAAEITRALEFLGANDGDWPKYTQMLLASAEFTSVN